MQAAECAPSIAAVYSDARLEVNFSSKTVTLDLKPVKLTRMEFRLLAFLARHAGDVVPRATLLMHIWGYSSAIRTRTLDVHVRRVRGKLKDYSTQHIETVFRVGYRLRACLPQAGLSRPQWFE